MKATATIKAAKFGVEDREYGCVGLTIETHDPVGGPAWHYLPPDDAVRLISHYRVRDVKDLAGKMIPLFWEGTFKAIDLPCLR